MLDQKYHEIKIQENSQTIQVSDNPLTEEKKIMKYSIYLQANSTLILNLINDLFSGGKVNQEKKQWKIESIKIKLVLDRIRDYSICIKNQIILLDTFLKSMITNSKVTSYNIDIHKCRRKCKNNLEKIKNYKWNVNLNQLPILEINLDNEDLKIKKALSIKSHSSLEKRETKNKKIKCPKCGKEMTKTSLYSHLKNACSQIGVTFEEKQEKENNKKERGKEKINCQYCGNLLSRNAIHRHYKESCKNYPKNK